MKRTRTRTMGLASGNHIHQTTDVTLPNSQFFFTRNPNPNIKANPNPI